ncbi:hypothetical protein [Nitrosomonas sp. Is37]|uniref:hypothetical protein n=1 Tax=Nitrosomonas sp. Is37 TaxID=3080535 RepID=UPI00294B44A5|nr:hypothetical protein [Nitrosomonas sp. Is37]MDV6345456.1 hypothetical protein [Nitrosomonas sp. Is37]
MADQNYIIRQQDKNAAVSFIDNQIASNSHWLTMDDTQRLGAELEYQNVRHDSIALNEWCQKWLNETQWVQLKNAISIARDQIESQKYRPPLKTIGITYTAWQILSELAKHDGVTLSEVIINRLGNNWLNLYNGAETGNYSNKSNQS